MSIFDAVVCTGCQKCVPIHKSTLCGSERRCTTCHVPSDPAEDPIIYCSTEATPCWIEALGLVHFDLLLGQVLDVLYPPLPLSREQETEMSFLCFPDANHVVDGDSIHDFVFAFNLSECDSTRTSAKRRTDDVADGNPAASTTNRPKQGYDSTTTELFCSTLFRQKKDVSIERGAQQKALLVMSRYPFPSIAHQVLRILCTLTFDTPGSATEDVLRAAFDEIRSWPPPLPTYLYRHSLLGRDLVPYTTPIYSAAEVEHLRWSESIIHSGRADEARIGVIHKLLEPNATVEEIEGPLRVFLSSAGCAMETRDTVGQLLAANNNAPTSRESLMRILSVLLQLGDRSQCITDDDSIAAAAACGTINPLLFHFRLQEHPPIPGDVALLLNAKLQLLQDRAHSILASPTSNRAECKEHGAQRGRHFFSEIEFHHSMAAHLPKLWKLWELLIIGAPIAILSYDAPTVSASCLSLAALIAPLRFVGVLRPYVTINNREVDLFIQETAGPSILFGTTNPFFVRRCMKWPHFLCLSKESDEAQTHKMMPSDSDKREKQQFKLKNRMFCSRHYLIKTDKSVPEAHGLLAPSAATKMSFVDLNPQSAEGTVMRQLRQQFLDFTHEFLAPLQNIVSSTLRRERPFFLPEESARVLSPEALLNALQRYTGTMPITNFKTRGDMLAVYKDFLQTNACRVWLQSLQDAILREILLSAGSLEEILLMDPDTRTRHRVLQLLQDEFERVLSRPIVDLQLTQKLSALCAVIPPLRLRLSKGK